MKIILFGSSGMLGRYVHTFLSKTHTVICVNRYDFDIGEDIWSNLNTIITNVLDKNDVIVNCAGIIPQKYKNDDYTSYLRVNTLFPHKINEISQRNYYKFIHITTDCVFDGLKGNYTDSDKHTATSIYGVSKSLGEPAEATIIRTSIIGEELNGKKSLIEWLINNKNKQINGFTNHYWNGVTCLSLARIIKQIITEDLFWIGVKHIVSPDIVTKYDLCKFVNDIYELNIDIIPTSDTINKNMTLHHSDAVRFEIDSVYTQLINQKKYNINTLL